MGILDRFRKNSQQDSSSSINTGSAAGSGLPSPSLDRIMALFNEEKWNEVLEESEKVLKTNPGAQDVWLPRGMALFNLGRYKDSFVYIEKVLAIDPGHVIARVIKAELLSRFGEDAHEAGKYREAFKHYDQAVAIEPDRAGAWWGRAKAAMQLDDYREAVVSMQRFSELASPEDASTVEQIRNQFLPTLRASSSSKKATELMNKGLAEDQSDMKLKYYDEALKHDPLFAAILINKGVTLSSINRKQEAVECYNRALEIDPGFPEVWFAKGLVLNDTGKRKEAKECFKNYLKYAPQTDTSRISDAKDYIRQLS